MDCPTEALFNAMAWSGWSEDGLLFAMHIYCHDAKSCSASLDLFVDRRNIATAEMDRYENGVFHFKLSDGDTGSGKGEVTRIDPKGREIELSAASRPEAAFIRTNDGWNIEVLLRWSELVGAGEHEEGGWLGFSPRLQIRSRDGVAHVLGATSPDRFNTLEDTPIAISPLRLAASDIMPKDLTVDAEEVIIQGEPWLEIEAVSASEEMRGKSLHVSLRELGRDEMIPFTESLGGRYFVARERYPLSNDAGPGIAVFLVIASAMSVGGYILGRSADQRSTTIRIVP